jgi:hypothetical protein
VPPQRGLERELLADHSAASRNSSLTGVEDLLFERGIDICHETVRLWWTRFGPLFAGLSPTSQFALTGGSSLAAQSIRTL